MSFRRIHTLSVLYNDAVGGLACERIGGIRVSDVYIYLSVLYNGAVGGLACEHISEVCACPCTKEIATKKPPFVAIGAGIGVSAGAAIAGAAALYMFLQSRKAAGQAAELTADTLLVNAYVLVVLSIFTDSH